MELIYFDYRGPPSYAYRPSWWYSN